MIRSVLAVLAGIATLTVASFAIEAVANPLMMRMFPRILPNQAAISHSLPATVFLFLYTALCVAGGGYVTAWVANRLRLRHAVIMGAIQVALTIWAMVSIPDQAPLANWIVGMVLIVPAAWCGGMLCVKRTKTDDPRPERAGRAIA